MTLISPLHKNEGGLLSLLRLPPARKSAQGGTAVGGGHLWFRSGFGPPFPVMFWGKKVKRLLMGSQKTLKWRKYWVDCVLNRSAVCNSLWPHGLYPAPLSMGILQARTLEWVAMPSFRGIFPTQGSNPGLPHCRPILYCLSHQGSPRILEWVAYPFSRVSSWPRTRTGVSCITGRFCTIWATREALITPY